MPVKLILSGEASLRRALADFLDHYHAERNHQGKGNTLMFPSKKAASTATPHGFLDPTVFQPLCQACVV
jgi:hypothetical protein